MSGYAKLLRAIKKYEGPAFTAAAAGLTAIEAEKVADVLIDRLIHNDLDDVLVSSALSAVREH